MKSITIATALVAITVSSSSFARPTMKIRSDTSNQCSSTTSKALLKYIDYSNNEKVQGIVLAEGTLSAVENETGNSAITVQFADCDFDFLGYSQGTSRNSGGSMGAPLEYFGHVEQVTDESSNCLTATPSDPAEFRFQPCSYKDDDIQLQQLFVRQIEANGDQLVAFVGHKNTTSTPYNGPDYWTLGKAHGAFPSPVEATKTSSDTALKLNFV